MDNIMIWIEDFEILFREDKLMDFFPTEKMSDDEKVNAVMRFFIYFSGISYLIQNKAVYLYIPPIVGGLMYFLHMTNSRNKRVEPADDSYVEVRPRKVNYQRPTRDNPFMNLRLTDYGTKRRIKPALRNKKSYKKASSYFDNLFKGTDDLHDQENFLRKYYTMPVTTVPDNGVKFAKWCYRTRGRNFQGYSPLNNHLHR